MRRTAIPLTVTLVAGMLVGSGLAAPVTLPSTSKAVEGEMWKHEDGRLEVSVGIETDYMSIRELDEGDAQVTGTCYGVKFDFSLSAPKEQSLDVFLTVGKVYNVGFEAVIGNNLVDVELEDGQYMGAGIVHAFTLPTQKIQLMANLMYRQTDAEESGAEIAAAQQVDGEVDISISEWHAAFVVAKKFERVTPYVGLRYSEMTTTAEATAGNTTYEMDEANAEDNVGAFAGMSFTIGRGFALDVEARMGDERAYSVGFNYTF